MTDKERSASIALERLGSMLLKDRIDLTEECILNVKRDVAEVLSNYLPIDTDCINIEIDTLSAKPAIHIAIPLA